MSFFEYYFQEVEQKYLPGKVSLNEATQTMDTNPIKTAITVCSELIRKQVKNEILHLELKMYGGLLKKILRPLILGFRTLSSIILIQNY